jgi:hypothetical protein
LSTPAAGWLADHFGTRMAFFALMGIGLLAVLVVAFAMPETRPTRDEQRVDEFEPRAGPEHEADHDPELDLASERELAPAAAHDPEPEPDPDPASEPELDPEPEATAPLKDTAPPKPPARRHA